MHDRVTVLESSSDQLINPGPEFENREILEFGEGRIGYGVEHLGLRQERFLCFLPRVVAADVMEVELSGEFAVHVGAWRVEDVRGVRFRGQRRDESSCHVQAGLFVLRDTFHEGRESLERRGDRRAGDMPDLAIDFCHLFPPFEVLVLIRAPYRRHPSGSRRRMSTRGRFLALWVGRVPDDAREVVGCGGDEEPVRQVGVGPDGGGQAGHAPLCGHDPEDSGEHAVLGLRGPGAPVGGVGAALGEEYGEVFGAAVDFDVPVVVVVGGGHASEQVGLEDSGGAVAGEEGSPGGGLDVDPAQLRVCAGGELVQGDDGLGDLQGVVEEGRGGVADVTAGCVFGSGEAFTGDVEVPDEPGGAVASAADAAFESGDEAMLEEPVEDTEAGAGGGAVGGVAVEVPAAQLSGAGELLGGQELEDGPVPRAEAVRDLLEGASSDAAHGLLLPGVGDPARGGIVRSRNEPVRPETRGRLEVVSNVTRRATRHCLTASRALIAGSGSCVRSARRHPHRHRHRR